MTDLSIIMPARNEIFLQKTIENILANIEGDTEIIAICDGYWPVPPLQDHPKITLIHHTKSIGQRAATNEGARLSQAKYIMKADAHCAFDKGFDVKLMKRCQPAWTIMPRQYNLHAFNWKCKKCGTETYQGPTPTSCEKCDNTTDFKRKMIWRPRRRTSQDFYRFDNNLKFQYWKDYRNRVSKKQRLVESMSLLGACWMMERERFWELDGLDETHGSWGQMGTEIACKTWLSGGKLITNRNTWYAHMFRTQGADFSFPYKITGKDVGKARKRSKELWIGNNWPKAKHDLQWLIDKFAPVPGWV